VKRGQRARTHKQTATQIQAYRAHKTHKTFNTHTHTHTKDDECIVNNFQRISKSLQNKSNKSSLQITKEKHKKYLKFAL